MALKSFWSQTAGTKPVMTQITSCRKVTCIEYTAIAAFVVFWLFLPSRERKNFLWVNYKHVTALYLQIFKTKINSF